MAKGLKSKDIVDNQFYSISESATILSVTAQTIAKYLRNGELKGEKKGPKNKWHVTGTSLKKRLKDWNMLN